MVDIKQDIIAEFKIIMTGDHSVGKTTFIKRHQIEDKEFERKYLPIICAQTSRLVIQTNKGPVILTIWDTAHSGLKGVRDGYYIGADAAIMMFDVTSRITYKSVPGWYKGITRICENIPIVLVGNKVDSINRKVKAKQTNFHRKKYLQYYNVSAKSNYQYEQPFIWILRKLLCDPNLYLIKNIPLLPVEPEYIMDQVKIDALEEEYMLSAQNHFDLDDEDDDEF